MATEVVTPVETTETVPSTETASTKETPAETLEVTTEETPASTEEETSETTTEETPEGDETGEPTEFPESMTKFSEEFAADGALGDESYDELAKMGYSREVVDTYIKGQQSQVSQEDADALIAEVGGDEAFTALQGWAGENLSEAEADSYNAAINSKSTAKMAVEWLQAKMKNAEGYDPVVTLQGEGNVEKTVDAFTDTKQVTAAMRDKRYGKDMAFTKSVSDKLARSDVF